MTARKSRRFGVLPCALQVLYVFQMNQDLSHKVALELAGAARVVFGSEGWFCYYHIISPLC